MAPSRSLWQFVDWFLPDSARWSDSEALQRTRLLVVTLFVLIPLTLLGTLELLREGTLLAEQGQVMLVSSLALVACLVALRVTGSHVLSGVGFCVFLVWAVFYLALTDAGLSDPILAWAILIPLIAAFVVGPWLAWVCAASLLAGIVATYGLELYGIYEAPDLSTPAQTAWFTVLSLGTAILFAAGLAWLYEGYTVRRLRRLNGELQRLRGELEDSEQRYRSLFENIPVGLYQSTRNGRITLANRALLQMLGVASLTELAEIDAFSLYEDPEDRTRLLERLDRDGEVQGMVFALRPQGRPATWVRESGRAARGPDGEVVFYEGVIEDVTAQRRAEQAARNLEERYRALVQHSTDTITIVDAEGVVRYQSPSIARNLGYAPGETVGRSIFDLIHPSDRRRVETVFRRAVARGVSVGSAVCRCLHADGHYVYVEAVASNMLDNPRVGGIVLTSRDVTERTRAEVALVKAKEQAEEVARLKSAFLANMSHEIRTPLTGIIGFAGVLAEEVDDGQREFVTLIERSGRRLLQTLNSVLDLARLESNQMDIEVRTVDVSEQVDEIVSLLQPIASEKGITLAVDARQPGPQARLDVGCLSRIVNNLVGNAIKFTDRGEVRATVREQDNVVQIEVRDTGIGIEETFVPHLFDEFKQESSGLGRQHEGSGLGLTITRRLVELMHGTIEVASTKGEGSVFTVSFPVANAHEKVMDEPLTVASPAGPRILVTDDNDATLVLLRRMLRDVGTVDLARTADEAVALVEKSAATPYDLMLLDIHLGGPLSGTDVLRLVRAVPGYDQTRIIAFTAFALPGDRERFLNSGFDGYLGKPFTREQLLRVVSEAGPLRGGPAGESGDGAPAEGGDDIEMPGAVFISG